MTRHQIDLANSFFTSDFPKRKRLKAAAQATHLPHCRHQNAQVLLLRPPRGAGRRGGRLEAEAEVSAQGDEHQRHLIEPGGRCVASQARLV